METHMQRRDRQKTMQQFIDNQVGKFIEVNFEIFCILFLIFFTFFCRNNITPPCMPNMERTFQPLQNTIWSCG